jgi:uncharacterized protein involved in exopolysaccharide biosynthesis/Mrp family chromosome partitioning ATPase
MTKSISYVPGSSRVASHQDREIAVIPVQEKDSTFGLSDVWALAKRRGWLIAAIVFLCTALAVIAVLSLAQIYTASSELVLERKDIRPFAADISLQSLDRDRSAAETEMDVLESREFAGRVVDKMDLIHNPNYNPFAQAAAQPDQDSGGIFNYLWRITGLLQDSSPDTSLPPLQIQRDRAISTLLSQYDVSRSGDSLAVKISVSNQNAQLAANIANTIAKIYVGSSLEIKQNDRIEGNKRALTTGGSTGGSTTFLPQGSGQPLLATLRAEAARLQQKRDELASKLGKNHPLIIEQDSQIASVNSMIDIEIQRILSDLEAESLKPSARILSQAEVPTSPSFPKPKILIPAAFVGSVLLALLLAILLETTDTRIRSGRRTSQILRIPNLGYVPQISANAPSWRANLFLSRGNRHIPPFLEAERSIYMACRHSDMGNPTGILMVTSCIRGTASASSAWGIAVSAAADGRSTVFIDLDFHEHSVPGLSGVLHSPKLVECFLKGETFLVEVIQKIPNVPRLGFIDATHVLREPSWPLNSKRLNELFSAIRKVGYDFIVLHAPPVLTSGDASWLSHFVDGVILSVTWGKTTEAQLVDSALQLQMNRAPLIGTIIDQVNPRVHLRRGYEGSVLAVGLTPKSNLEQENVIDEHAS